MMLPQARTSLFQAQDWVTLWKGCLSPWALAGGIGVEQREVALLGGRM